jgi:hypothetical protein
LPLKHAARESDPDVLRCSGGLCLSLKLANGVVQPIQSFAQARQRHLGIEVSIFFLFWKNYLVEMIENHVENVFPEKPLFRSAG